MELKIIYEGTEAELRKALSYGLSIQSVQKQADGFFYIFARPKQKGKTCSLSKEQKKEIERLHFEDKLSYKDIGERLHISAGTAYRVIKDKFPTNNVRYPERAQRNESIVSDFKSGAFNAYTLSKKYNLSVSQIYKILR